MGRETCLFNFGTGPKNTPAEQAWGCFSLKSYSRSFFGRDKGVEEKPCENARGLEKRKWRQKCNLPTINAQREYHDGKRK